MPYQITSRSLRHIAGAKAVTVTKETAPEAWKVVDALMASDETVTIINPYGGEIGWKELKMLADQEAS